MHSPNTYMHISVQSSIYKSCYFLIYFDATQANLDLFRPRFFCHPPGIPKSGTYSGPRGAPWPGPDASGIAIATMCGSCAPGPQKRQLRPSNVSLYISIMNGRSLAERRAQAWARGASACGHRHGQLGAPRSVNRTGTMADGCSRRWQEY